MIDEIPERRRWTTLFAVGVIPFLVLAAWHWRYGPLTAFGDWAQYMLHADALLHGRAYGDIGYIFTSRNPFIGPPVQPPGLPAVLVPVLALTDGAREGAPYKLLMLAFVLAFLAVVTAYFSRLDDRALALAATLLTGLWIEVGFATNAVQPDVGFSALVWGVFYLADRPGEWSWGRVAGITVLGLAALAFRLAALPLVPALALYAVLHRRELGGRPWVPVLVWCAGGAVAAATVPGALAFARLVPRDPAMIVRRVVEAATVYPFAILDLFLYPFPWNHVNDAYHVAVAGLAVIGFIGWVRHAATRLLTAFLILYVGMLLVLPMQDTRYLMPLAPLALYSAVAGAAAVARWVARRARREMSDERARRVAVAAFTAIALVTLGHEISRPAPSVLMDGPGVRPLFARLRAEHSRTPLRVLFMNPRVLTWETGIPAMGFFRASADTTIAELRDRRITHVVVGDLGTDKSRAESIRAAVVARPELFRPLFTEGAFTVYAFALPRAAAP